MERKKTVQELTSALGSLKIQEAVLTAQLRDALAEREQELSRIPRKASAPVAGKETRIRGFAKGDRIWVTNSIRKPASWDNSTQWEEVRSATVTQVLIKGSVVQVHFTTDNGVNTWRAPNNIRLAQQQTTTP